jgi:hypothetical protein
MNALFSTHKRLGMAALLVFLSASAIAAQEVKVPFRGAYDGRETDTPQGGSLLVNGSGAGTASHVGRFTYTWQVTVDMATGLSTGGVFRLAAANNDVINGSFVGLGTPTETPNVAHILELVTITGGTGRFEGATGNFTLDRLVDLTTGLTSGSLNGTISAPGSNK